MMTYAKFSRFDKSDVHDVLMDIRDDVRGLFLNLSAIRDQGNIIEPEQLGALSDMALLISEALDTILEHTSNGDSADLSLLVHAMEADSQEGAE